MSHAATYLAETISIAQQIDAEAIEKMVRELVSLRERGGRLFIIGLGGSAANASHAVNDFRKLCGIEAYAPTDNVAELTARTNDEGWETVFREWLDASKATSKDALFVLSVGGGTYEVSLPITHAVQYFYKLNPAFSTLGKTADIYGIVGRDGGVTKTYGKHVVLIPTSSRVTPHTEGWQSVVLHCIVSHPDLQRNPTKW